MPAVFFGVVADDTISNADLSRQSELFQQLKRAVNRGDIGVRIFFPETFEYILGADMPFGAVKRVHHHYALGRETITFGL